MTTILVPLDGSENAEDALPWAAALARRRSARLLLVAVVDIPMEFGAWTASRAPSMGEEVNLWMADSEAYLRKTGDGLGDVQYEVIVKLGSPAGEIAAIIEEHDDAIVVMSSHGRTGARRILMGSVATRIVHDSNCPVLVVRYADDGVRPAEPSLDRVLVPLDGSEFSEHALETMTTALGEVEAIHLLRVVEMPALRAGSALEPGATLDYGLIGEYMNAARDEAVAYLHEQQEGLTDRGHVVTTEVREGRVSDEILSCAKEQQADVIAMATHGRGGLGRLVFGSVAERVLSEASAPLLLIRPTEH